MLAVVAPTDARQARVRRSRRESRDRIVAAATELVRTRSYAELSVEEVMAHAGLGRTIFYRHFDDLGDLLLRASGEAIGELYDALEADPASVGRVMATAAAVYERHGPLLRAVAEASAGDAKLAAAHAPIRVRFDVFAAAALGDRAETARALNLMNETYLLDAFGREPRVSTETAAATLAGIWKAVIGR